MATIGYNRSIPPRSAKIEIRSDDIGNNLVLDMTGFTSNDDLNEGTLLKLDATSGKLVKLGSSDSLKSLRGKIAMCLNHYDEIQTNQRPAIFFIDAPINWSGEIKTSETLAVGDSLTVKNGTIKEADTSGDVVFAIVDKVKVVPVPGGTSETWVVCHAVSPYAI